MSTTATQSSVYITPFFVAIQDYLIAGTLDYFDLGIKIAAMLIIMCPDRLWGPPSLLSNGYRGSFPRD
jgi:hypothetical protein